MHGLIDILIARVSIKVPGIKSRTLTPLKVLWMLFCGSFYRDFFVNWNFGFSNRKFSGNLRRNNQSGE